jgi:hypothetical protein
VGAQLALSATAGFAGASGDWPFPDELRSRLVFVHPLVNYAVHPAWQRQWEQSLARGNGVQITVGSVASEDLMTDVRLNVSEPLDDRFRFLYRINWLDGLHLDRDRQQHWLGFEARLAGGLSGQIQVHPAADKEEFDLMAGFLLTDTARLRYLRLGLRFDDFMYTEKNAAGGSSDSEPVSLQWELRQRQGRWEIFSEGRYGSSSRRTFPDSTLAPDIAAFSERQGCMAVRLRYLFAEEEFVALETNHYTFAASESGREPDAGFAYANEYLHVEGLAVLRLGGAWGLRPEVHWLRQWASSSGRRNFDLRREDFFPAVFVELRAPGRSTWELGYMATHHQWEFREDGLPDDYAGFTDKVKLGWTFAFTPRSRLTFSLSHEVDIQRFGGGNVQYQMMF